MILIRVNALTVSKDQSCFGDPSSKARTLAGWKCEGEAEEPGAAEPQASPGRAPPRPGQPAPLARLQDSPVEAQRFQGTASGAGGLGEGRAVVWLQVPGRRSHVSGFRRNSLPRLGSEISFRCLFWEH